MAETQAAKIARLDQWTKDHEKNCEARLAEIRDSIGGVRDDMKWLQRMMFGLLIGVIGWLAVQLWNSRDFVRPQAVAVAQVPNG